MADDSLVAIPKLIEGIGRKIGLEDNVVKPPDRSHEHLGGHHFLIFSLPGFLHVLHSKEHLVAELVQINIPDAPPAIGPVISPDAEIKPFFLPLLVFEQGGKRMDTEFFGEFLPVCRIERILRDRIQSCLIDPGMRNPEHLRTQGGEADLIQAGFHIKGRDQVIVPAHREAANLLQIPAALLHHFVFIDVPQSTNHHDDLAVPVDRLSADPEPVEVIHGR